VLRTGYRLRSVAIGDRARCFLQGREPEGLFWVGAAACGLVRRLRGT
jgi:hypothetical protein